MNERHRFSADVVRQMLWLYVRFSLKFQNVEEVMAALSIEVSYLDDAVLDDHALTAYRVALNEFGLGVCIDPVDYATKTVSRLPTWASNEESDGGRVLSVHCELVSTERR